MKIGPVHISVGDDGPAGVWLTKTSGAPQNVTVPVVVGAVLAILVLCCCARVVF